MMECDICFEPFNAEEQRPKVLPCGHTFCLLCLKQGSKNCPMDRKMFRPAPANLPDNFKVLEMCQRPVMMHGWCKLCGAEAKKSCLAAHGGSVCSLQAARDQKLEPRLEALQAREAALSQLEQMLDTSEREWKPVLANHRDRLKEARAEIKRELERLKKSFAEDPTLWLLMDAPAGEEKAGVDPVPLAADLLAALASPSTSCVTALHGGAGAAGAAGALGWSAAMQPISDPATRLYLCGLLCGGALRVAAQPPPKTTPLDPPTQQQGKEAATADAGGEAATGKGAAAEVAPAGRRVVRTQSGVAAAPHKPKVVSRRPAPTQTSAGRREPPQARSSVPAAALRAGARGAGRGAAPRPGDTSASSSTTRAAAGAAGPRAVAEAAAGTSRGDRTNAVVFRFHTGVPLGAEAARLAGALRGRPSFRS